MGLVYATVKLSNGGDILDLKKQVIDPDEVREISVRCLVDSGATHLCINEHIQEYLQLPVLFRRKFQNAHGVWVESEVVGPVQVEFEGIQCLTEAIILPEGSEPLLGAIPMESMDLVISPKSNRLMINEVSAMRV